MSKPVVEVQVRAVATTSGGFAIFLGNEEKVFVMLVDQSVGAAIARGLQRVETQRPLTHELMGTVLQALGARVERVVVNGMRRGVYLARLVISAQNELQQRKLVELDARPSDCIAMAIQQAAPIYVSRDVWVQVEDVTKALENLQAESSSAGKKARRQGNKRLRSPSPIVRDRQDPCKARR